MLSKQLLKVERFHNLTSKLHSDSYADFTMGIYPNNGKSNNGKSLSLYKPINRSIIGHFICVYYVCICATHINRFSYYII